MYGQLNIHIRHVMISSFVKIGLRMLNLMDLFNNWLDRVHCVFLYFSVLYRICFINLVNIFNAAEVLDNELVFSKVFLQNLLIKYWYIMLIHVFQILSLTLLKLSFIKFQSFVHLSFYISNCIIRHCYLKYLRKW